MDPTRFDALAKALRPAAPGAPRRALLGAVLVGAFGAVVEAWRDPTAAKGKRRRKKKKKCKGQKCGAKCIPSRACCTSAGRGTWLAEGAQSGQCGVCVGGTVVKDPVDCLLIDPEGCTVCSDAFACVPAPNGTLCEGCGTCHDGFCEDPDETRQCGDACCSGQTPFCVDPGTGLCCPEERACPGECCTPDSGLGLEDGEICTREGCCPEIKSANNCRADHPTGTPCPEKICCAHVWTQEGRGLACPPGALTPPGTRGYCCGPGKACCFTGCCPEGSRCCGGGMNCCPDGEACGSDACFDPVPDHV